MEIPGAFTETLQNAQDLQSLGKGWEVFNNALEGLERFARWIMPLIALGVILFLSGVFWGYIVGYQLVFRFLCSILGR